MRSPPASAPYNADMSWVAAVSSTTQWLTTASRAPAARNAHANPTGSTLSLACRPDSQALSVTNAPPKSSSSTSDAVIQRSNRRKAENIGLVCRYCAWQAMCTIAGPGTAVRSAVLVAADPTREVTDGHVAATTCASATMDGVASSGTAKRVSSPGLIAAGEPCHHPRLAAG